MPDTLNSVNFAPRAISVVLLDRAKLFWGWSLALGVLGPLFGLASGFLPLPPEAAPIVLVLLALLAEVLQWQSDTIKDVTETLLRMLDLHDAFGWSISEREMSNVLAQNEKLSQAFAAHAPNEAYFGSMEPPGTGRALANLAESAWWSKHLAREMGQRCLLIVACLVVAALIALVASVEAVRASTAAHAVEALHAIGNVVTATLTLVFSLGLTRLGVAYLVFSGKAEKVEERATQAAARPDNVDTEAVKLWQDYHLARITAPFIPTWYWRRRRPHLNMVWQRRNAAH